jgi:hypothetical protein
MAATSENKDVLSAIELERADPADNGVRLDHKIHDGDDALKILYGEFEPYTKEEEKRVLRKIDIRMIIVMLIINGLQFVDKNVRRQGSISSSVSNSFLSRPSLLLPPMALLARPTLWDKNLVC